MIILQEEHIGNQRLILGDSLEVMKQLDQSFDAIITDPPYNFSTASSGTKLNYWSDAINASFWFAEVTRQCATSLNGFGFFWQFLNWKTFIPCQKACWDNGLKFESVLVWDKGGLGPGGKVGLRPRYELASLIALGGAALPNRSLPDIWHHKAVPGIRRMHRAQKPLDLIEKLVSETPGQTILDPFMGSGTTLVACEKQGRNGTGIELDPRCFPIACERLEKWIADGEVPR